MKIKSAQFMGRRAWKLCCFLGGMVVLFGANPVRADDESLKSQLTVADEAIAQSASNAYRILYIGDSITRHGTNEGVLKQLGWDHVSGMAASSEAKDYVHLLAAKIQATLPDRKVEIYFDSQARKLRPIEPSGLTNGSARQKAALVRATASFNPHLVVIQLGEHEDSVKGPEAFRQAYEQLVRAFAGQTVPPKVVCAGVWQPGNLEAGQDSYSPNGWAGTLERVMQEVCLTHKIPYASVRPFALDPSCRGVGKPGVSWHPNDKGMEGYARVLFEAFQQKDAAK